MLGLLFMAGSMALTAYGSSQQRKELKRQEDEYEQAKNEEMAFKRQGAADMAVDIKRAESYGKGAARAIQASSGTAVGIGSNVSQVDNIAAMARKKMESLGKQLGYEGNVASGQVEEFGHRTDAAVESSYWQQGSTMLAQGYQLGLSQGWWGVDMPSDQSGEMSGESGFDQTGGMSGMSGQGYWRGGL